jgi:transcriptional regulator with XRE-family HTH domain
MAKITYLRRLIQLEIDPVTRKRKPQYQIAGDIGIHPATLASYANGDKEMTWYHRQAIAQYFGIEESELDQWIEIDAPE